MLDLRNAPHLDTLVCGFVIKEPRLFLDEVLDLFEPLRPRPRLLAPQRSWPVRTKA
jgi:hypothetical protein